MKPTILHCEANVELTSIAKQYVGERSELAHDFLHAFRAAKEAIEKQPDRFAFFEKPVRRVRISGFPYQLVYEEMDDFIHVLAIMHDRRKPGYWRNRLS